jgi:hypothetical protein
VETDEVLTRAAMLAALSPEEFIFPGLLEPRPARAGPTLVLKLPVGALYLYYVLGLPSDDDNQTQTHAVPGSRGQLRSLTAGIIPPAFYAVILR